MHIKISDIKAGDTIQVNQLKGLFKVLDVATNAIQVEYPSETSWLYITDIDIERHYPAVPNQEATNESQQQKQHKHKDLIIAWANGAEIQYSSKLCDCWMDCINPAWAPEQEYRIKPTKAANNIKRMYVEHKSCLDNAWNKPNLELEFDAESGKLVKATILE